MGIRKKKLIDKGFQLRTVFSVTAIAMAFFALIILLIGSFSYYSRAKMNREITKLEKAIETENNIITAFMTYAGRVSGNPIKISSDYVKKDHEKSITTIKNHISLLERQLDLFFYLVIAVAGIAACAAAVYYVFLVRMTHRISGPIFVMSRHLQEMIEGREPQFRDLRDKDEFKEMYAKLVELGGKMKEGGA